MVNADKYKITFSFVSKHRKKVMFFHCALLSRAFNTEKRQKNAHDLRIGL